LFVTAALQELVREQRVYKQASEDLSFAAFEASLAKGRDSEGRDEEERRDKKRKRSKDKKDKKDKDKDKHSKKRKHKDSDKKVRLLWEVFNIQYADADCFCM
jgi:hypothetical protein